MRGGDDRLELGIELPPGYVDSEVGFGQVAVMLSIGDGSRYPQTCEGIGQRLRSLSLDVS